MRGHNFLKTAQNTVEPGKVVDKVLALYSITNYIEAELLLAEAFKSYPPDTFLLEVLFPLLVELGECWQEYKISVVTEHAATTLLRQYLDRLIFEIPRSKADPLVICACAPGEIHELGNKSLVYFLRKAGFNALYLGTNLPEEALLETIDSLKPVGVCLSATTTAPAQKLISFYKEISATPQGSSLILGYGGRYFDNMPNPEERALLPGLYLENNTLKGSAILLEKFSSLTGYLA